MVSGFPSSELCISPQIYFSTTASSWRIATAIESVFERSLGDLIGCKTPAGMSWSPLSFHLRLCDETKRLNQIRPSFAWVTQATHQMPNVSQYGLFWAPLPERRLPYCCQQVQAKLPADCFPLCYHSSLRVMLKAIGSE
jgi:hypothetical protein